MTSTARVLRTLILIPILGWCLTTGSVSAQQGGKLGEMDLPHSPIVINLSDASVQIIVTDSADPGFRWWPAVPDSPGSTDVAAFADGAAVVIARPALSDRETAARIRVEIVIGTEQSVSIVGDALDLEMESAHNDEPPQLDLDEAPATPVATTIDLQLTGSEISLSGVGAVVGTLESSTANFFETTGNHELTLRDSELRVAGHLGAITVEAEGADVIVEDAQGSIAAKGFGGSVDLRSTRGRIKIELVGANLHIHEAKVTGLVALTDSSANIRDTRYQKMSFKSVTSYIATSSCQGDQTIDFTGGSLTADSGTGAVIGTARDGARIDLADHRGDIKLNLQADSSTDLRMIAGDVNLTSHSAEVSVDGAKSLTTNLVDTWATLIGIEKLTSFQAHRSEVDLDLTATRERAVEIAVRAGSSVQVHLASPCRVQAKGLSASLASQVDVTGCELQLGRGTRWATRRARGIDGQPPIMLTAQVADSAELIVEGRP